MPAAFFPFSVVRIHRALPLFGHNCLRGQYCRLPLHGIKRKKPLTKGPFFRASPLTLFWSYTDAKGFFAYIELIAFF